MFGAVHLDDLDDGIGQVHGVVCSARRQLLAMIAAFDRREGWRAAGQPCVESYLVARLGVSRREAGRLVRLARSLEELPAIAAAYDEGRISDEALDHVVALATPETDAAVAADAVGKTVAELELLARQARRVSREEANDRHRRRYLHLRKDGGLVHIRGVVSDVDGATVEAAIHRVAEPLPVHDPDNGLVIPFDERCADALVLIAGHRIAGDADPDRASVIVHVEDGRAELDDGTPLADDTARRICCDARIQAMLHGPDHRLVAISTMEHVIPPALRRKILRRDRHCRWLGCDRRLFAHVHHLVFHGDGGPTVDWNLVALCPFHHRLVHEGGWTLTGDPHLGLVFTSPHGKTLTTGPPPLRPEVRQRCLRLLPRVESA